MVYYKQIGTILAILLVQMYSPIIYLKEGVYFVPDFLLIYMTYLSVVHKSYIIIVSGFLLGLFQDITTQVNLLGVFAFSKSLSGYLLTYYSDYNKIWNKSLKIIFLLAVYFFHFSLSSYLMFDRAVTPLSYIFLSSLMQSSILVIVLLVINKFILIDKKIFN